MRGPIDYIIVGFEGNKFDGSILGAVADAIDQGVISLVTLSVIQKDAEGTVNTLDIATLDDAYIVEFSQKYKSDDQLVTAEDIDEVAD